MRLARLRLFVSVDLPLRRDVTELSLTPEQADAVARRRGRLLVAANAGSGKTTVLVERFVRFVLDDGYPPDAILAITFTEKAAGQMRAGVRRELLARGQRRLAQDTESAWISTIHGLCTRILRTHAVAAGLDPRFVILDGAETRALREAAFDAALAGLLADGRPDALDLAAAYTPDNLRAMVLAAFDQLRSAGATPPRLPLPDVDAELDVLEAQMRDAAVGRAGRDRARAGDEVGRRRARCARRLWPAARHECRGVVGHRVRALPRRHGRPTRRRTSTSGPPQLCA